MQFERGILLCVVIVIVRPKSRAEEPTLLRRVQCGVLAPDDQLLASKVNFFGVAAHLKVAGKCVRAALLARTLQFGPRADRGRRWRGRRRRMRVAARIREAAVARVGSSDVLTAALRRALGEGRRARGRAAGALAGPDGGGLRGGGRDGEEGDDDGELHPGFF